MTDPRTAIGGNQPPAHEHFALHIEDLFALISDTTAGATVTTDEQETALAQLLDDVRQARKDADAKRAEQKKPHDDAAKAVQALWKPLIDRCDMAADEIKRKLTPYREAKARAKDEAAAKAREKAEARLQAAQAAFQQSDDLNARFAAEGDIKATQKLTAQANRIDRSATGLRTRWAVELTDPVEALKHYRTKRGDALKQWLLDQANEDVRTGQRAIPGFAVTERKIAA